MESDSHPINENAQTYFLQNVEKTPIILNCPDAFLSPIEIYKVQ